MWKVGTIQYWLPILTSKLNGSSVTPSQVSRVGHLTAVDTNIRFCHDTDCQHVASFTESDGVVVHPSVGIAHRVTSGDSAGESGGVSHHSPRESCCDLHLRWYCIEGTSDRAYIIAHKGLCDTKYASTIVISVWGSITPVNTTRSESFTYNFYYLGAWKLF